MENPAVPEFQAYPVGTGLGAKEESRENKVYLDRKVIRVRSGILVITGSQVVSVITEGEVFQAKRDIKETKAMSDVCLLSGTNRTRRDPWKGRGSRWSRTHRTTWLHRLLW